VRGGVELRRQLLPGIVLLLFLGLVMPLVGCQGQNNSNVTTTTDSTSSVTTSPTIPSKKYTNTEYAFTVEYPEDWEFEEALMQTLVLFAGPSTDSYMININIVTEQLPRIYSVEDYAKIANLQFKKTYEDYVITKETNSTIDGLNTIIRTFTMTVSGVLVKDTQAYFIKDKTAFIITYDANEEAYDKYTECFDLILSTFKFD
jgi:hypothetical protein